MHEICNTLCYATLVITFTASQCLILDLSPRGYTHAK